MYAVFLVDWFDPYKTSRPPSFFFLFRSIQTLPLPLLFFHLPCWFVLTNRINRQLNMFDNISSWFSSKKDSAPEQSWNSQTATIQNQQPTSPDAPSTERAVTEQPVRPPSTSLNIRWCGFLLLPIY